MDTRLCFEDRFDGASNFITWKEHIQLVLEANGLLDLVDKDQKHPIDVVELALYKTKDSKARLFITDGVKDHVIPHLIGKTYGREMWVALTNLYQNNSYNRKMVVKEKLRNIDMAKGEGVTSYLTRIRQVKDELAVVGEKIDDVELVHIALGGFTK
jgi:hypothetical protein